MTHRLKTLPEYFFDVATGRKRFEIRKDDREPRFEQGDTLMLEEYSAGTYTANCIQAHVDLVLRNEYCKDGCGAEWNGMAHALNWPSQPAEED